MYFTFGSPPSYGDPVQTANARAYAEDARRLRK